MDNRSGNQGSGMSPIYGGHIDAQFIVAVLSDKLKNIDKKTIKNDTIVTLSQDDKLLKIQ
ncbi:MAG: hypothetical protein OXJ52_01380 [Oligoflexia bacterium]|nr:hypothetical protein [Oligoflexia bacterium]